MFDTGYQDTKKEQFCHLINSSNKHGLGEKTETTFSQFLILRADRVSRSAVR